LNQVVVAAAEAAIAATDIHNKLRAEGTSISTYTGKHSDHAPPGQ
jgi:hypothetical protein